MGLMDGIIGIGSYDSVPATALAELIELVGDPDETVTNARSAGSNLDEMSPIARAQLRVELDALAAALQIGGKDVAFGTHTVIAAEDTANLVNIVTGLDDIVLAESAVSIVRAGAVILSDQAVTEPTPGTIRVANGATTYVLTTGDVINWMAVSA